MNERFSNPTLENRVETARIDLLSKLKEIGPESAVFKEGDLDTSIQELLWEVGSKNEVEAVRYDLRMSAQEFADSFGPSASGEPFKSHFNLPPAAVKRREIFVKIGGYLLAKYKLEESRGDVSEETRSMLQTFLTESTRSLFEQRLLDIQDDFYSIDPNWRETGEVKPATETEHIIRTQVTVYLTESGKPDSEQGVTILTAEVMDYLHGGDLTLVNSLLSSSTCPEEIFKVLSRVADAQFNRQDLTNQKMTSIADSLKYLLEMSIDTETYFEIFGYTSVANMQETLADYLENPILNTSLRSLLQASFSSKYQAWEESNTDGTEDFPITYRQILRALAIGYGFAERVDGPAELQASAQKLLGQVQKTAAKSFPAIHSPHFHIQQQNSPAFGSRGQAFAHGYWDRDMELLFEVILDSHRTKTRYPSMYFHENGHAVHLSLASLAAKAGWCSHQDIDGIPTSLKEEFAFLIQEVSGSGTSLSNPESTEVSPFSDLYDAFTKRYQAQVGLIQMLLFKTIEERVRNNEEIDGQTLRELLEEQVNDFRKLGTPIAYTPYWIQSAVFPSQAIQMEAGIMYMNSYLPQGQGIRAEEPEFKIREALIERFKNDVQGEQKWYEHKDARAVVLYAMAISGDPQRRKNLGQEILHAEIDEVYSKLLELGINESEI